MIHKRISNLEPEKTYYVKEDIDRLFLDLTVSILKRLHRRMQMRGVRIMQVARKGKRKVVLLYRAYTWEEACRMIEIEMEALECRIKKINRT